MANSYGPLPAECLEDADLGPLLPTTAALTHTRLLLASPGSLPERSRTGSSLPASSDSVSCPTCCLSSSFWVSSSCDGTFPAVSMALAKMGGGEAWTFRASSSAYRGRKAGRRGSE